MIKATASFATGAFHLDIEGHSTDDDATCAAVTAMQQTMLILLQQLAALRPDQLEFTITAMEAIP